ncbi:MAG: hypothetical protein ACYC6V_03165, partial [Bacillota bacterium]
DAKKRPPRIGRLGSAEAPSLAHVTVAMVALTAMQTLISVLATNRRISRFLIGGMTSRLGTDGEGQRQSPTSPP